MLRYTLVCLVMLQYAILCYNCMLQQYAKLYYVMLYYTIQCYAMSLVGCQLTKKQSKTQIMAKQLRFGNWAVNPT